MTLTEFLLARIAEVLVTPLRHLASVYADHPDYRQEWRP